MCSPMREAQTTLNRGTRWASVGNLWVAGVGEGGKRDGEGRGGACGACVSPCPRLAAQQQAGQTRQHLLPPPPPQVDGAKGIEPQTRKLFAVARLRKLPIFTFINKAGGGLGRGWHGPGT